MKNGIVSVLLVLILAAGIAGGKYYREQYLSLQEEYESTVVAAQEELDAAVAERDGVAPLDTSDEEKRIAAEKELLDHAQGEIDRLNAENREIDASIAQAEQDLLEKQADEEYAYYKAAYDSMAEGKALVESYLEDN